MILNLNSHVQNIEVATNENGDVIHIKGECQPEMKKKKKNYLKEDIYFTRGDKKLAIIAHKANHVNKATCWSLKSKSKIWQFFIC